MMEFKELFVVETMYRYFNITARKSCSQLLGEHIGIASCGNNLTTVLGLETAQRILITVDVLHFIDKQIISSAFGKTYINILVKTVRIGYMPEGMQFLIDIKNICRRNIGLNPFVNLFEHKTFTYSPLTGKYDYRSSVQKIHYMIEICATGNKFHNMMFLQIYKLYFVFTTKIT